VGIGPALVRLKFKRTGEIMNLLDIRTQFVAISGRYDLVLDSIDYEDNGANFYINIGQAALDKMTTVRNKLATIDIKLAAGDYSADFGLRCMSVSEVWINDGKERTQLEKVSLNDIKSYFTGLVSSITTGRPIVYSLASLDVLNASDRDYLGTFLNLKKTITSTDYRGVILAPVTDAPYVLEVLGQFHTEELTADQQENYWTLNAPEMLIKAALKQLYILSGRQVEYGLITKVLDEEVMLLEKNKVEEEIADVTVMEG
jgi:hypothetical protein